MTDDLSLAKQNEAYHRKQMEYYQEQIKILESNIINSPQDERANKTASNEVRYHSSQSNSNKRDMGNPVDTHPNKVKQQHQDIKKCIDNDIPFAKKYLKDKEKDALTQQDINNKIGEE